MKKKNAFVVTIETILLFLLCTTVVIVCLQMFSANLSDLFGCDPQKDINCTIENPETRNYKKLFLRNKTFGN